MKEKDTKSGKMNLTRREFLIGISGIILAGCEPTIRKITETLEPLESTPDTSFNETSSESGTLQPTETKQIPTEKPAPEIDRLKEILTECPVVIEVDSNLKGPVLVRGEKIDLNHPEINLGITIAIDKMTAERGRESHFLPINSLKLNSNLYNGEVDPRRQIVADFMFNYYKIWQYTDKQKYLSEREGVTFNEYLDKVGKGEDVGFSVWAREDREKTDSTLEVHFEVPKTNMVSIFSHQADPVNPDKYFSYQYIKDKDTLINYYDSRYTSGQDSENIDEVTNAYQYMISALCYMAASKEFQTHVQGENTPVLNKEAEMLGEKIAMELFSEEFNNWLRSGEATPEGIREYMQINNLNPLLASSKGF